MIDRWPPMYVTTCGHDPMLHCETCKPPSSPLERKVADLERRLQALEHDGQVHGVAEEYAALLDTVAAYFECERSVAAVLVALMTKEFTTSYATE